MKLPQVEKASVGEDGDMGERIGVSGYPDMASILGENTWQEVSYPSLKVKVTKSSTHVFVTRAHEMAPLRATNRLSLCLSSGR